MKFEDQVKKAKEHQLQNRIIKDVVFILLGIVFLIISIFMAVKDQKNNEVSKNTTTTKNIIKK